MASLRLETLAPGDLLPALISPPTPRPGLARFAGVVGHDLLMAYLARLVTEAVDQRRIRHLSARFIAAVHPGDVVTCSGRVAEIFDHDGERRARLELATMGPDAEVKLAGEAIIALD